MKTFICMFILISSMSLFSKNYNQKTTDEKTGNEILIGYCTRQALTLAPCNDWYDPEYKSYEPNQEVIKQISPFLSESMQIIVVFGSFCGDSKEQIPRFLK